MSSILKELLANIDELWKQIDAVRPLTPEQEQRIFSKFRLDWNYHSNAIEGNQLSEGETRVFLLEGLTAKGKRLKDHLDMQGHNEVIAYLQDFVRRKAVLTEVVIREMHKILLVKPYLMEARTPDGKPTTKMVELGTYKSVPNEVTRGGIGRQFTSPLETPAKMTELMNWLRTEEQAPTMHPVEKAALFHHQFVSIHPFDDGNGRMGRILMNLLLMQAGYPPVVIKIQEREAYFAALVTADAGEPADFVEFIAQKVSASMELYLRAARGESIDEIDDINKKIKLLAKELTEFPDGTEYSPNVYRALLTTLIEPLLKSIIARTSPFDDMFREAKLDVFINRGGQSLAQKGARYAIEYLSADKGRTPANLKFTFRWENFKKTPFYPFSVHVEVELGFEPFICKLAWRSSGGKSDGKKFLYSAALAPHELEKISASIAEMIYNQIQEQRTIAAAQG